jgi:hypothetical protein
MRCTPIQSIAKAARYLTGGVLNFARTLVKEGNEGSVPKWIAAFAFIGDGWSGWSIWLSISPQRAPGTKAGLAVLFVFMLAATALLHKQLILFCISAVAVLVFYIDAIIYVAFILVLPILSPICRCVPSARPFWTPIEKRTTAGYAKGATPSSISLDFLSAPLGS